MESQIMMIGAAIFVGSAILVYIISIFGIREKTYDEVIEEQRRERIESMKTKVRVEKREKYRKKYKRSGKEKDDREDSVEKREDTPPVEETIEVTKMVELEIEPEIIEPAGTPKSKAKKAKKQKPILLNKEEKSYTAPVQDVPETFHPKHLPKDEVEMKHTQEEEMRKEVAPKSNKIKKKHEPMPVVERMEKTRQVEVESEIMVSQVAQEMAAPPVSGPEKVRKSKKRHDELPVENGASDPISGRELATALRNANMSDAELQALIDILLNKQAGKMEWNKKAGKSDPISVLKKQLEDKEKSLQEEQQIAMAHQVRIKELQKELQQEKGRYLVLNKTSMEKVEAKDQECMALQRRMHQTHEQHVMEMSKAKMQMGDAQAVGMVQKLQEENKQLKEAAEKAHMNSMAAADTSGLQQQLKIVQGELNNNVIKLSALDNAKRTLEQKVARYEDQLRKLETSKKDTESVFSRKLQEVNEELRKTQNRNSSSEKEIDRSVRAKEAAETECANLKNRLQQIESSHGATVGDLEIKLQDAHGSKSELEKRVQHLESQVAEKEKVIHSKESEMKGVLEENAELRCCKQRQAGEGQESPQQSAGAPNGDVHPEEVKSKISITEHEKVLSQLQGEMQTKDSTISSLQTDLESQKKKNNALREKNWKAMDALSQTEKMAADMPQMRKELTEKDSEIKRLGKDLETQQTKCSELSEQFQEVSAAQEQLKNEQETVTKLQEQLSSAKSDLENVQAEISEKDKRYEELLAQSKVASSVGDQLKKEQETVSKLQEELSLTKSTLENLQSEISEKTKQQEELSRQIEASSSAGEQLQKEQEAVASLQEELTSAKSALENAQGELTEKSKQYDELSEKYQKVTEEASAGANAAQNVSELEEQLSVMNSQLDQLRADFERKQQENVELSEKYQKVTEEASAGANAAQNVSELEEQLSVMSSQLDQLRADFERKQQENVELLERYQKISEQLMTVTSDQGASDNLQQELTETKAELDQIRGDLEQMTQEKEELREKNWKAMEALNKAEEDVRQRIADALHSEKENSAAIVQEEINKVRQKLIKIFPAISVDEEDSSDWWDDFEEKAKEHINSVARRESMQVEAKLNESLEVQTKLQTQVEHYKTVLNDTESMLNKLQSSVETEEKKWQEKLSLTEKDLHAAKSEMESLQDSVTQMKGSTEMEVKIENLEAQLDDSEKDKEVLSSDLKEMEEKSRVLDDELTSVQREKESLQSELKESQDILSSVKSELEKLKISLAAQEQIKKELDRVKTELESEKSSKQELAQSNAKMNSLLKVGQEALLQEQETVKKLQSQLEEVKKTPNGETESKEVDDLKAKLAEREKQLEREIASNRALSQKLAVSAGNKDVGTSV